MHPVTYLQSLPDLAVLAIILPIMVAATVLAPVFGGAVLRLPRNDARDTAAFDAFKVVVGMTSIVVTFSLVQAMTNLRASEALVGREAATFAALDRSLLRSGMPDAVAIRPLLTRYGEARVELEWPGLGQGLRDGTTTERFTAMSVAARNLQPGDMRQQTVFAEVLKNIDDLAETREATIQNADLDLPAFFWLIPAGQLTIGLIIATLTAATPIRLASLAAAAAAVSLLLALLVVVDHPFGIGETSVRPSAIVKILAINRQRA